MTTRVGLRAPTAHVPLAGFSHLKHAVSRQFEVMSRHDLFRTAAEGDELWQTYLASFPEGTNPVYRKRPEHDCSCCRQFIRAVGNVVAVVDGKLTSLWDGPMEDPTYAPVTSALAALVRSKRIVDRFLHYQGTAGTDKNHEDQPTGVKVWEHLFVRIPNSRVCAKGEVGPKLADARSLHDVLWRRRSSAVPTSV